ncbi:UDP-N-acetylmuramate--L-alanine ligase [Metallumcola ferriviriculae]|uniref:UDP-N-acetylmuramate--L-alanine ligase n=1 Tax=Metallumcola ferriviriculae TaxID=3039180 RepID=A0AAU0UM44_9FIRM|nr:UDP-N-acetylmuramate--L-alanine ligase [Desulfitibacteraceae bacterium MK1]
MSAEFGLTHFIGIGGAGMSAIATVLLQSGCPVSGSDLNDSPVVSRLREMGAQILIGHNASNLPANAERVVFSTAISLENSEVQAAKQRGIPIIHRADMLSKMMNKQKGIAISGAHGKTTTSAMIGMILLENGLDPTVVVGGYVTAFNGNSRRGKGDYLVAEADESDGSFLKLYPHVAIVTNVEDDHMDYYQSLENIQTAFKQFVSKVPEDGLVVLCTDDLFLRRMAREVKVPLLTYGTNEYADFTARNIEVNGGTTADIWYGDSCLGKLNLAVPGRHNLLNALAGIAVAFQLGLSFEQIANSLSNFKGVGRRFQTIGRGGGIWVVDDYAHHPTEIKATVNAAKDTDVQRIIAVFQPHRYTRTKQLYREFGQAFQQADLVILDDVYSAGEGPVEGVSSKLIYQELSHRQQAEMVSGKENIVSLLEKTVRPGDLILTLGAGDVWKVAEMIVERLGINGGAK